MSTSKFSGPGKGGLATRALRGSAFTFLSFGGTQALRLASNLVLTRILMPEVFGLMALVQVFVMGLQMFSDTGINTSIIQNKRGDDPSFLNTAWTVQIIRGVILWLMACALAIPAAALYDLPDLVALLPVAGLNALLLGFRSTRMATANRHLLLGRLTLLELGTQAVGIVIMVGLALWWQSVWVMIIGGLITTALNVGLSHLILPGQPNRLKWEPEALRSLFSFGKYIFLGSIAGFLINSGDRAILGKFISLAELGIYNIGFFLATVPLVLSRQLVSKVMFPLYASKFPAESADNRAKISKARFLLTGSLFMLCLGLGLAGEALITFLYEPAYHLAGSIMVLLAISSLPMILIGSYSNILLAAGNSRDFTLFVVVLAAVQTAALFFGVQQAGLMGAILAPALSAAAVYPLLLALIRPYRGWDLIHDAVFGALALVIAAGVLWYHDTAIAQVLAGLHG